MWEPRDEAEYMYMCTVLIECDILVVNNLRLHALEIKTTGIPVADHTYTCVLYVLYEIYTHNVIVQYSPG